MFDVTGNVWPRGQRCIDTLLVCAISPPAVPPTPTPREALNGIERVLLLILCATISALQGVWSPHFGDWDRLPSSLPPPREHFGDCERPPSSFPQQPHLSDRQRPPSPFLPPDHISNPHLSSSRDPGYNDEDGNDKRHHHSSQQQQQQQLPLPLSTPPPPARSETIQTDKVGRRRHADSSMRRRQVFCACYRVSEEEEYLNYMCRAEVPGSS
ncbi:hypothetical protein BGW80DRAFT_1249866 [Lactifluus volemus]|nr:hypothetical protein BGW80DRAFT_1249866 [Lactifluus volemus]